MKRKKWLLFVLIIALFFPTVGNAQEEATQVGIGFSELGAPKEPVPPTNNVLPLTSTAQGVDKVFPASTGTLPKTGEQLSYRLRGVGIFCLMICFWLFLFFKMKEEELDDEKR